MPSEIGIEIWKYSILVRAKNAELDCRCLSNISYYDGWAQKSPSPANSGGTKGKAGLLHVDRRK